MISTIDDVCYWLDIAHAEIGLRDVEYTKLFCKKFMGIMEHISIRETGVFFYMILDDFDGTKSLVESLFYIKPECRGSLRLVLEYIKEIERIAKVNNCKTVKIGANIRYKDSSFMKLLQRCGYACEVASKDIHETME